MRILSLTVRREAGDREPPRLVVNNYPHVVSLIEFGAGALKRQNGTAIEFEDFYLAYHEHCTAKNARALAPAEAAQTNELCRECGITIQQKRPKTVLGGRAIVSGECVA